ncbi:MAG TPA: tryptophan synthase subunit alpha, partial [Candidatus Polarisedimenticolaceae bacterium]|nr:tryptophan synthase subunit alpha [Candidatus Polarisedimenticolaceae bacterium]
HRIFGWGADVVEVGVPFSDPVADGPVIQRAAHDALAGGTRLRRILDALESDRPPGPVVLMSYLNPLLALGRQLAAERIGRAGVSGLIVPDLPADEARPWLESTRLHGIELIPLVAPTSDERRIASVLACSDGLLYYVSVTGTTGVRRELDAGLPDALDRLRRSTGRPVAAGFGISTPEHVQRLRRHCDGVVVGSRIVEAIRRDEDLAELIGRLKEATRGGRCWS